MGGIRERMDGVSGEEKGFLSMKMSSVVKRCERRGDEATHAARTSTALQQPSIPGPETWPKCDQAFKVSLSERNGLPWRDREGGAGG